MRHLIFLFFVSFLFAEVLKVGTTPKWEPFNTLIKDKLAGISVDYWKLVAKKANLKYKFIIKPLWIDVLNDIKNEKIDIALGTGKTKEKEKYGYFSKPYASFPLVIATKDDVGFIPNVNFLKNKIIAVGKGYTAKELLIQKYPFLSVIEVDNIDKALSLVKEGKVFAAVDILPVIAYKINKFEFNNLKISGQLDIVFPVRFMISKNKKYLVEKINKAIDSITIEEKEAIYKKWVKVNKSHNIYLILISVLSVLVVVLAVAFLKLRAKLKYEHEYELMLEKLANYDKLTGIYNRAKLEETLELLVSSYNLHKEPFCVIFFDIDNFKEINDKLGHQIGDIVLTEISAVVQSNIRKKDVFGRWGGEEFMIILEDCKLNEACMIANNLKNKIQEHDFGIDVKITCSFGVSEYNGEELIYFLRELDEKLYKAKKEGKNKVIC